MANYQAVAAITAFIKHSLQLPLVVQNQMWSWRACTFKLLVADQAATSLSWEARQAFPQTTNLFNYESYSLKKIKNKHDFRVSRENTEFSQWTQPLQSSSRQFLMNVGRSSLGTTVCKRFSRKLLSVNRAKCCRERGVIAKEKIDSQNSL